jgi:hypothetical protein
MNRNRFAETINVEFELDAPRRPRAGEKREAPGPEGSTPRLTRLMALAIKCLGMVERSEVLDYAELARVGYVTRARMSQIMNLVNLAPDIQEEILFLPKVAAGRFPLNETTLRNIACQPLWDRQRAAWRKLREERPC